MCVNKCNHSNSRIKKVILLLYIKITRVKCFTRGWSICWDDLSHIDKLNMVCTLYKLLESFFPLPYGFGKQWTSPNVCASQRFWPVGLWARATGVPCPHEWARVRLCDELSRYNMVSEPKVVPGMMWLTCEGECWKYFTCETRSHIDKIVGCWVIYILHELIFLIPYDFGKQWISLSVCASQHSSPWICGPEPTGVPCTHEWATMVRSKIKNGSSEKNSVPTLIDHSIK